MQNERFLMATFFFFLKMEQAFFSSYSLRRPLTTITDSCKTKTTAVHRPSRNRNSHETPHLLSPLSNTAGRNHVPSLPQAAGSPLHSVPASVLPAPRGAPALVGHCCGGGGLFSIGSCRQGWGHHAALLEMLMFTGLYEFISRAAPMQYSARFI